jgi:hypothetical protein
VRGRLTTHKASSEGVNHDQNWTQFLYCRRQLSFVRGVDQLRRFHNEEGIVRQRNAIVFFHARFGTENLFNRLNRVEVLGLAIATE